MKRKHTKSILRLIMLFSLAALLAFSVACKKKGNDGGDPVFTLDKTNIELTVDENVEVLTLTIANVEETPEWTSSNDDVATVTVGETANKATVRGVSKGNAVISVTAGSNIAVCTVKVNPGTHLDLITESLDILVGRTGTIRVDTDITSLSYSSDNTSVATVNDSGLVTGISAGNANITVSGGNKSVICPVTVIGPSVSITKPANAKEIIQLTLKDGENTYQLEAESNGDIEWKTGDTSIATVDENGLVTAVAEGETTVTASYGSAEDTRTVKVKGEIITVTLSESEYTLQPNENFTLEATVTSSLGELDDDTVTWTIAESKDTEGNDIEGLVSVDENGKVTSLGNIYGTAKIRATSNKDADSWAECTVTVPDPYADWIKISDKESLINALVSENENVNMLLLGDIDLEGAELDSKLNAYRGTFDGFGYEIMNYSGKLFHNLSGTVQNLILTYTTNSTDEGICHHVNGDGVIKNCRIEVTFGEPGTGGIGCFVGGKVENTIILAHNPNNVGNVYAATVQNNMGSSENVFYAVYGGNVTSGGATLKTDEQLKTPATFEGWDTEIWQIEEGAIPTLKNGGNIGEVKVSLNETEITIHKEDTLTLIATVKPAKLPQEDKAVIWASSDESIATVDENGVVTALKEGTVTITATSVKDPTKSASCEITVDRATVIELTSPEQLKLEIGEKSLITATVNNGGLIYISSDESVATVDENGRITAVSAGEITVTVQSVESAGKSVVITVKVMPEVQLSVDDESEFDMEIGATHEVALNTNRPDDNGVWTSSNEEVATVENGVITAHKAGRVTITYTSAIDSKKFVSVKVTVQEEVVIDVQSEIIIKTGYQTNLGAVVNRGGLIYQSSDEEVVTVNENGRISALKEGEATITVTSTIDESKTAECVVTVSDDVEVTISLNKTTATLDWDATLKLTVRVNYGDVEWSISDNDGIATLKDNEDGTATITALREDGTVTVTVTSKEDENKSATCEITIAYVEPEITITRPASGSVEMEIGDKDVVEYEVSKGEASIEIEGEEGVLSFNGNEYTALKAGTVTVKIVCTETDLTFEKTFTVTVKPAPEVEITNRQAAAEGVKLGTEFTLTAQANREDGAFTWSSGNEGIATIDNEGTITTVGEGDVTFTVTFTTKSGLTATDTITVTIYDGAILELALEARSVAKGATWQIDYKAAGGTVIWTSSNENFVTVENGVVKGVAVGKSVITASVEGTEKTKSMVIAVYEKAAGATEVSTAEQFKAMNGGTYYIVNDIDMKGETVDTLSEWVKVDGLGYKVYNFKTPKLFTQFQGYMRNIEISCVLNGKGNFDGLFGAWLGAADGTVENCIFDITFSGSANQCAFAHHNFGGTVNNVILKVSREDGASGEKFPAWFEAPQGTVNNMFVVKGSGTFSAVNGATEKTEAQLKSASTFDESWEAGWVIIDGEMPQLKGALVTEPLKVKIDKAQTEIYVGENDTLTAIVTPSELSEEDRAVIWESLDGGIATVNQNGVVTGVAAGVVAIRAVSAIDGEVYAECKVTVNAIELSINEEDKITELKLGAEKQLNATANRGEYEWSTDNDEVATVDENGLVTATGIGTVTITVTSKLDPKVSDSITIKVSNTVVITVELSETELSLDRGATATLTATLTNSDNGVTWESSDKTIATVDENGVITTYGKDGSATITATSKDDNGEGKHTSATCEVTVAYVKEVITVENEKPVIPVGGELTIKEIATASKGAFTLALKAGSEEGIVSVEDNKITALSSGEVTVVLTWSIEYADIEDVVNELTVTVFAPQVELSIDAAKRTLKVGEASTARTLHVTLDNMPASPKAEDVVWTSGAASVATVTGGYSDGAYTGEINALGEGSTVITAKYTVEGIDYTITCEVAVVTLNGWTAVYDAEGFKKIGAGSYYIANDIDMGGEEVTGWNETVKINGLGYTVSNFVTPKLVGGQAFGGEMRNIKLSCDIGGGEGGHGLFGLYTTGTAVIENCIFEVDFVKAPVQSVLAHHCVSGTTVKNVIIIVSNTIGDGGNAPGFYITDGGLTGSMGAGKIENAFYMVKDGYRAGAAFGVTLKTEAQLKDANTYDESWLENWIITDGEMPELMLVGFPQAHRHTFDKEWTTDATSHWHAANCGDTDEKKDFGDHDWNSDGICSVCGYIPEGLHIHTYGEAWITDGENHWKEATCEGCEGEIGMLGAHDTDGVQQSCSVCGYVAPLSYELEYGGQDGMGSNRWIYWSKGNDCGGDFENGTVTVTFKDNDGDFWTTQMFYKDSAITNNAGATVSMTITSTVGGHITVNNQVIELEADKETTITVGGNNGNAVISIQMGNINNNSCDIEAATITFSNITITK